MERLKKETERKKVPEGGQFWIDVAKRMVDRNYSQCRQRYFLKFNGSFPEHLDQGWTPELDWELLQKYVLLLLYVLESREQRANRGRSIQQYKR